MRLQNKIAAVTGAARGIGLACAQRFAQEGCSLVLSDIDEEALRGAPLSDALRGSAFACIGGDASDPAIAEAIVQLAVERYGRLDIMLSNAGIFYGEDFLQLKTTDFQRVMDVNVRSVFTCGQAAGRQMVRQGGGTIINMSSITAVLADARQAAYVASKGAVNQLTKAMALSLAPHNVRVNAIGPGTIDTEFAGKAVLGNEQARERVLSRTPLRRLGRPDEVAGVAVFLASDDASYITGQTIYVDGGRLALGYTVSGPAAPSEVLKTDPDQPVP